MPTWSRVAIVPVLLLLLWQGVFAVQVLVSDVLNFKVQRTVIFWGVSDNKPTAGEIALVRGQMESALGLWPQNPDYLALLARLYGWQGQIADRSAANEQYRLAIVTMRKSLEQRGGNPYSWAQYAEYLATQRDRKIELDIAAERVRLLGAGDQKLQQRMQALVRR